MRNNEKTIKIYAFLTQTPLTLHCYIIFVGPWSGPLLKKLGYTVPLQPIKIPVYYWKADHFLPHTWIYEGKLRDFLMYYSNIHILIHIAVL